MPLAITLRMPFLIHLQKVESLSAGVTTEEVKVERVVYSGQEFRWLPVVFTASNIFQHSLCDFAEISQLCFHLGRNPVAVLWEVAGVNKKLITVELGS